MAVGDAQVFPGFLTPVLTQLFFPKPPTTFLTCFCRGEGRKYTGMKSRLNQGSNSQPPGRETDKLTTEPPGRGLSTDGHTDRHTDGPIVRLTPVYPLKTFVLHGYKKEQIAGDQHFLLSNIFSKSFFLRAH